MCTAHYSDLGGLPIETPLDRDPTDRDPPWTDITLTETLPGQTPSRTDPTLERTWDQAARQGATSYSDPLWIDRHL